MRATALPHGARSPPFLALAYQVEGAGSRQAQCRTRCGPHRVASPARPHPPECRQRRKASWRGHRQCFSTPAFLWRDFLDIAPYPGGLAKRIVKHPGVPLIDSSAATGCQPRSPLFEDVKISGAVASCREDIVLSEIRLTFTHSEALPDRDGLLGGGASPPQSQCPILRQLQAAAFGAYPGS